MLEGIPKSARYSTNERSTSSPKLSLPNSARLDHFGKRVRDLIALRIAQNPIKKQIIKMGENSLPSLLRKPKEEDLNYSFSFCD